MLSRIILIVYIVVINFIGIGSMASDKIRAMEHRYRIPEAILLLFAIIGGSIGSILGMLLFHHKTRKPLFRYGLPLILIVQIGLIILLRSLAVTIEFI